MDWCPIRGEGKRLTVKRISTLLLITRHMVIKWKLWRTYLWFSNKSGQIRCEEVQCHFEFVRWKAQETRSGVKDISLNCACVILTSCFERCRAPRWQNVLFLKSSIKNTFSPNRLKLHISLKSVLVHRVICQLWILLKNMHKQPPCPRIVWLTLVNEFTFSTTMIASVWI